MRCERRRRSSVVVLNEGNPKKRHRGEPGHTRDTVRAHTGGPVKRHLGESGQGTHGTHHTDTHGPPLQRHRGEPRHTAHRRHITLAVHPVSRLDPPVSFYRFKDTGGSRDTPSTFTGTLYGNRWALVTHGLPRPFERASDELSQFHIAARSGRRACFCEGNPRVSTSVHDLRGEICNGRSPVCAASARILSGGVFAEVIARLRPQEQGHS